MYDMAKISYAVNRKKQTFSGVCVILSLNVFYTSLYKKQVIKQIKTHKMHVKYAHDISYFFRRISIIVRVPTVKMCPVR